MALQDTIRNQTVTILIILGALVGAVVWYVSNIPYYETIPAGAVIGLIIGIGLYRLLNPDSDTTNTA
jgi:ABC-type transporter Mla maintaining outer membrane lipid asymmetry permease subunit MlaE